MVFEDRGACYHVMSRTAGGERLFGEQEKEAFVLMMKRMARFSGVEVLTYAVMGNHFHLLVRVPERAKFLSGFYRDKPRALKVLRQRERLREQEEALGGSRESVRVEREAVEATEAAEAARTGGKSTKMLISAEVGREVAEQVTEEKLPAVNEEKLLAHLRLLYSKDYLAQLEGELRQLEGLGKRELREAVLQRYLDRLCRLPVFVKEVKERFSRWFNKCHGRRGTLWMDRYKCLLVEDGRALRTMAAYIDLNPLRAGLVEDPREYRWSGYAEAVAGSRRARRGLCRVLEMPQDHWKEGGAEAYRCLLLRDGMGAPEEEVVEAAEGAEAGREGKGEGGRGSGGHRGSRRGKGDRRSTGRRGFSREAALRELEDGGKLSVSQLLSCRVRYFSDGMVLGSRSFVERIFEERREWFGAKRRDGARGLPLEAGAELFSLRKLRVRALE